MFDSLQIYCQKVNYLNQKQIFALTSKFKDDIYYLKKKHLTLCLETREEERKDQISNIWLQG